MAHKTILMFQIILDVSANTSCFQKLRLRIVSVYMNEMSRAVVSINIDWRGFYILNL